LIFCFLYKTLIPNSDIIWQDSKEKENTKLTAYDGNILEIIIFEINIIYQKSKIQIFLTVVLL